MATGPNLWTRLNPAPKEVRQVSEMRMMEERATAKRREHALSTDRRWVKTAIESPFSWATEHTMTYNEHWTVEGRPSPYEPFPRYEYIRHLFDIFDRERIVWIEKSRDMMVTWACVAYLTLQSMTTPECGVVIQTQKEKKVIQLIDYAKCLYRTQDARIQAEFPLEKSLDDQPALGLYFANGARIEGIPGGADQIRSYHPWGYLNDESSFQPDAGECYNEALAAVKGKVIFNSSAGPGWYADARNGVMRNAED